MNTTMTTKKIKLTTKRTAILEHLQSKKHAVQTAQSIKQALPNIDLATIYRGLEYLHSHGLVEKILLPNQESAYEYSEHKHHHVVCGTCGDIQHVDIPQETLDAISEHIDPKTATLTLRGSCKIHK